MQGSNDSYKPPTEVLRTAVQPSSGYHALSFYDLNLTGDSLKSYVCFHFAEIAKLTQGKKREFIIHVNGGNYTSEPITLDHLKPLSICLNQTFEGHFNFSINATAESDLPPILNAFEQYTVYSLQFKPTDSGDGMFFCLSIHYIFGGVCDSISSVNNIYVMHVKNKYIYTHTSMHALH